MTNSEFSAEKFRLLLKTQMVSIEDVLPYPGLPYPSPYWSFYYEESSTVYHLDERKILAMSDEEILEAYARWRIES